MTRFQMASALVLGALMLVLQAGCDDNQNTTVESRQAPSNVTTLQDLESQLVRQVREQWPAEEPSHVRIIQFNAPQVHGAVQMVIDIGWATGPEDTHIRSLGAGLTLYRAADDYLVGTLIVEGKTPLNVILKFE